ncbi:hypothetical protein ACFE04_011174 [Oxalis oulophora]
MACHQPRDCITVREHSAFNYSFLLEKILIAGTTYCFEVALAIIQGPSVNFTPISSLRGRPCRTGRFRLSGRFSQGGRYSQGGHSVKAADSVSVSSPIVLVVLPPVKAADSVSFPSPIVILVLPPVKAADYGISRSRSR